jgi:hypothetical protein
MGESIMLFGSYRDAVDLIAELVIAESRDQLPAWQPPCGRQQFI